MADSGFKAMICVDESDNSFKALNFYVDNFHRAGTEVVILHVSGDVFVPVTPIPGGLGMAEAVKAAVAEIKRSNKAIYDKYDAQCKKMGLEYKIVIADNTHSSAGPSIVSKAESMGVNVIVVGTRGLGVVRRTILGSVSDYVLHHSHIPVLLCPKSTA